MLLSERQMIDYKEIVLVLDALPRANALLGNRGYDANGFRKALAERDITACIPSKKNRKVLIPHNIALYRQRHKIENIFGKLKDWRRILARYDRCARLYVHHLHSSNHHLLDQSMNSEVRLHGQGGGRVSLIQC